MKKLVLLFVSLLTLVGLTSCGDDYFLDNYEGLTDKDHVYYQASVEEIIDILDSTKEGAYVIYFGFPSCPWCQGLTPTLNQVAKDNYLHRKEKGQNVIYYFDIKEIRSEMSEEYLTILDELGMERPAEGDTGEAGVSRISVPYVVGVYNGDVIDQYMWDDSEVDRVNINDEQVQADLYTRLDELVSQVCDCNA